MFGKMLKKDEGDHGQETVCKEEFNPNNIVWDIVALSSIGFFIC